VCPASHPIAARRARVGAAQAPLADLASEADARLPGCGGLARELRAARRAWAAAGGEASLGGADLRCVLPLADGRSWPWQVIPDSVMSWAAMLSCKCCCDVPMCLRGGTPDGTRLGACKSDTECVFTHHASNGR